MTPRRVPDRALPWLAVLAALGLGELVTRSGLTDPDNLPPPTRVLDALVGELGTSELWRDVGRTLEAWGLALMIAAAVAVPLGIVIGSSPLLNRSLRALIEFLRPIPSVALIPLAILVYGNGLRSQVFLAVFACFWILLVQSMYGVRDLDPVADDTARAFRVSRAERVRAGGAPRREPVRGDRPAPRLHGIAGDRGHGRVGDRLARAGQRDRRGAIQRECRSHLRARRGDRAAGLGTELAVRDAGAPGPALASRTTPGAGGGTGMSVRARRLGAVLEVLVPLAALGLLAVWSAGEHSYYYPPLGDVFQSFADTWVFERVGSDVLPSLARMTAGLAIALVVGVALGTLLGRSRRARLAATPLVEFLRATPPTALLPVAIVALGVGNSMKVFVIAFGCVWPILLNTIDGVAGVDPVLDDTAGAYRVSRRDRIRHVVLPAAGPQIFAGIRLAVFLALILMVVSEMVAGTNGIGHFILESQRTFDIAQMWSGILLLGLLGYAMNGGTLLVERRLLRWHRCSASRT